MIPIQLVEPKFSRGQCVEARVGAWVLRTHLEGQSLGLLPAVLGVAEVTVRGGLEVLGLLEVKLLNCKEDQPRSRQHHARTHQ